jgi:hydroxymethylpyrimidine pyrophosphatase-like HAD family hydrolase
MSYYFHAIALDYDGTLTHVSRPDPSVLAAVREVRDTGRAVVLVTGRILSDLRADFPDVDGHFDAMVAENGAVLWTAAAGERPLANPVSRDLEDALMRRGVPLHRGRVLLAMDAAHSATVNEEIARLGLDCQLMRNRAALMVLPAGVNKGSGLREALALLRVSQHSTLAIGDAENDHALLDACEIGVAVANAVPALRAHADLVLDQADGAGIAQFLRGALPEGLSGIEPRRWTLRLGHYDDGSPVLIPASHVNLGIQGVSGAGKSYLAGLIAEQLIALRYTVCVIDLEGDHVALANLPGAVGVGGPRALLSPAELAGLVRQGVTSVISDLSLLNESEKRSYALDLLEQLRQIRHASGTPQWIVLDEAHVPLNGQADSWVGAASRETGLCLVTYRPEQLAFGTNTHFVITVAAQNSATLARGCEPARRFVPAARKLPHVRHWHKYLEGQLPLHRHFVFRDPSGPIGLAAGNVPEFEAVIARARADVLKHHAGHGDFSRWLRDLGQDQLLARSVSAVERDIARASGADNIELLRAQLLTAINARFGNFHVTPARDR